MFDFNTDEEEEDGRTPVAGPEEDDNDVVSVDLLVICCFAATVGFALFLGRELRSCCGCCWLELAVVCVVAGAGAVAIAREASSLLFEEGFWPERSFPEPEADPLRPRIVLLLLPFIELAAAELVDVEFAPVRRALGPDWFWVATTDRACFADEAEDEATCGPFLA